MGTRADFYLGRGEGAEWLGSITWDGYPDGIDKEVLEATSLEKFRTELARFFSQRTDVTYPEEGWPWPWDHSGTSDYAYTFDADQVFVAGYGYRWRSWSEVKANDLAWEAYDQELKALKQKYPDKEVVPTRPKPEYFWQGDKEIFPNMATRRNNSIVFERSGLMILKL